ncbi:LytR/AlgR family response regulator transcription factor [Thermaerobacter litoralis]
MTVPAERQPELERPDEQERAGRQRPEREGPDGLERPQGYERRPRSERQPEGRPEEDRGADAAAGPLPATGTGRGPSPAGEPGRGGAAFDPNGDPEWEWDLDGPPPGDRPIRALIVDDEYPARAELRYRLSREPGVEITGEAATAREALRLIGALDYDVVFLDIAMPGISGLELAERLKQQPGAPYVIFTTAYDEYAVKAFEARALDYLLKPYSDDRLREALSRVRERLALRGGAGPARTPATPVAGPVGTTPAGVGPASQVVPDAQATPVAGPGATATGAGAQAGSRAPGGVVAQAGRSGPAAADQAAAPGAAEGAGGGPAATGGGRGRPRPRWVMGVRDEAAVPIPVEEVVYAEAENDQVFVYTATHRLPTRYTLRELEDLLPPDRFFRCHRGYIVNLRKVREISPFFNGTYNLTVVHAGQPVTIPVARSRVPELKRHFWPEQAS